ncbi:MAG TPA: YetF domain-containing protein [Mycobacteriales bacterium]|jgi:uncharacterized membrane protein YcaP (DUF421 family)
MDIVWRAAAVYAFLLLFTRALGKRELVEMSAFEMIVLVTIGDLVQQGVTQEDYSVTGAILAVSTFGFLALLGSWLTFRSRRARDVLEGRPVVVVNRGKWVDEALRIERITRDEVLEAARNEGIGDLADVRIGVLEPDGKFSFVRAQD